MKIATHYIVMCLFCLCLCASTKAQNLLPVKKDGLWGYIDTLGRVQIPFQFDLATEMENGLARATKGPDLYLISDSGTVILRNCDRYQTLTSTRLKILQDGKWFLADKQGNFLTENGYDRIWKNPLSPGRYFVSLAGLTGLIDDDGSEIMPPIYFYLRPLSEHFYLTDSKLRRHYQILKEDGNVLTDELFLGVTLISKEDQILHATSTDRVTYLYNDSGKQIVRGPNIKVSVLGNHFLSIEKNKKTFLFDALRNKFYDTISGIFNSSLLLNTVTVTQNNITRILDRDRGFILQGGAMDWIDDPEEKRVRIFRSAGYFGLINGNNEIVLKPIYGQILNLDSLRFRILDTNFLYGIFNHRNDTWESPGEYTNIYTGDGYIKAIGPGNFLDHYLLNPSGDIKEVITYFNVRHTYVNNRNWNEDSESEFFDFNSSPSRGNVGWYSVPRQLDFSTRITLYGLRKYDSATSKWKVLVNPIYRTVRVLNVPTLSIVGYNASEQFASIPVVGLTKPLHPPYVYGLMNDATGKKLTPMVQYLDAQDCESANSAFFRTFVNGRMQIISKANLKTRATCLYASRQEYGMRRIYTKGSFQLKQKPGTSQLIEDNPLFTALGLNSFIYNGLVVEGGEWLLFSSTGEIIKPPIAVTQKITYMGPFIEGKSIVILSNGKCGVIDTLGNTFIEAKYDYITTKGILPGYYFCGYKSYRYGLVNRYGEMLTAPVYDQIESKGSVYYGKLKDSGFLFNPGTDAIALKYKDIPSVFENELGFIKRGAHVYFCKEYGHEITDIIFKRAKQFHNGYAPVQVGTRWGLIDENANFVIKPKYSDAHTFEYTTAAFKQNNQWVFVKTDGDKIPRPKGASAVSEIAEGIFVYKKGDRYGIFDETGRKICQFKFVETPIQYNNYIIGIKHNLMYFFDLEGNKLGTLACDGKDRNKQLLLQTGRRIQNLKLDNGYVLGFSAGQMRAFGLDSPWTNAELPMSFSSSLKLQNQYLFESYKNDVYLIGNKDAYKFVNSSNESLTRSIYYRATPMQNGLSIATLEPNKVGILDKDGFWVMQPEYADIQALNPEMFKYRVAYDYEIYNPTGSKILNETVESFKISNGIISLQSGNKQGYYREGNGMIWGLQE